jgi:hypothetical protein
MHNGQRVDNCINIPPSKTLEIGCTSLIPKRPLDVALEACKLLLLKVPEVQGFMGNILQRRQKF